MAIESIQPTAQIHSVSDQDLPVVAGLEHNGAYDSSLTRGPAQIFERVAEPLNEHVYGPLTEKNRLLGMVAANATLTAPRLLEPLLGERYVSHLREGHRIRAGAYIAGKALLKLTDGLDGPVTRANGITSLFGAGFDAGVDMVGTRDDGRRIKEAYQHLDMYDSMTAMIIDARLGLDVAVAVVGGVGNTLSAKHAEATGAVVPAHDQPKANAFAKLKFGLSCGADMLLLAGTIPKRAETREAFKKVGTTLLAGSVAAGLVSLVKYSQSTARNVQRSRSSESDTEHL